jgi:hypothetical protein
MSTIITGTADNESHGFIDGRHYKVLAMGDHVHWDFEVGRVYEANEMGLVDSNGTECWAVYDGMSFELLED